MLELKRHVPELGDLTDAEAQMLGFLVTRLSRALMVTEGAEHVYAFVIGDSVPHFHLHLLPRYPGAPREYWGVRVDEWPGAPHGNAAAVAALCARIRDRLATEVPS